MRENEIRRPFFVFCAEGVGEACWQPHADIYRIRRGWIIKLDLAGVKPEDIQLKREGSTLIVEGVRRDIYHDEDRVYYCLEIAYSHFRRRIPLPFNLEEAEISTEYKDGIFLIQLIREEK